MFLLLIINRFDIFQLLSILLREDAELLLEAFGEILRGVEAHLYCHIADQDVWVRPDDALSLLQADAGDEGNDRLPRCGFHLII